MTNKIPPETKHSIDMFVLVGQPPGGFLMAVLCNDLKGAVQNADAENYAALREIVGYVFWEIPADCWGDKETVHNWMHTGHKNPVYSHHLDHFAQERGIKRPI